MSAIPKTRICVSGEEAERLRAFVRQAEAMNGRIVGARVARREDAAALAGLLGDPSIGPRIYTMPSVINAETMAVFIEDHLMQRARGEGVLFTSFNRSIRLLSRLGFVRQGEVIAHRPDGTQRPSLYCELEQDRWNEAQAARRAG